MRRPSKKQPSISPKAPGAKRARFAEDLVTQLQAKFGPHVIYRLGRAVPKVGAVALSTGSLGLDRATGIGGIPRGRVSVVRGGLSSGKTTLAYHLLAEAQRDGGLAALIDGEGASDPFMMRACGVDVDDLILASPLDAVEALEMVDVLARCRALDGIVCTALPHARPGVLAVGLQKLANYLHGSPAAAAFIADVDGRAPSDSLAFTASVIVETHQLRPVYGPGGDIVGLRVRAVVAKNRLAPPGGVAEFDVLRRCGIDRPGELVDLGLRAGVIERYPSGLVYGRVPLGKSAIRARLALEDDPDLVEQIAAEIRAAITDEVGAGAATRS